MYVAKVGMEDTSLNYSFCRANSGGEHTWGCMFHARNNQCREERQSPSSSELLLPQWLCSLDMWPKGGLGMAQMLLLKWNFWLALWSKQWSTCLANSRPWVQTLVRQAKKMELEFTVRLRFKHGMLRTFGKAQNYNKSPVWGERQASHCQEAASFPCSSTNTSFSHTSCRPEPPVSPTKCLVSWNTKDFSV
jgi:hypothetical protein